MVASAGAGVPAGSRPALVVFAVVALLVGFILTARNQHLFTQPIAEEGDFAANSLLVLKAKRFELLHGHYSRMGFYHPGPSLLYVSAGAEWLFHDVLRLTPAPHNAHILGHILLNACLVGLVVAVAVRVWGSRLAAALVGLTALVYCGCQGHLGSHWFAHVFFPIYLAFLVTAASVGAGRVSDLGWMALTGGLAVHAHVCFVAFVAPVVLCALAGLWLRGRSGLREPSPRRWRAWAVFAAVSAVMVLPIALHTALHFPGELCGYLNPAAKPELEGRTAGQVVTFLMRTLTNDSPLGWWLVGGALAAATLSAPWRYPPVRRAFALHLVAVAAISTVVMGYYAARKVDDLCHVYLGLFFGSVLVLALFLIALRAADLLERGPAWSRAAAVTVGVAVTVWTAVTAPLTNLYAGDPALPALADKLASDPRWGNGPLLITLDHDAWPEVTGLVLQLRRRDRKPWLPADYFEVPLGGSYRLDGRPLSGPLWHVDASQPAADPPPRGARRCLGTIGGAAFYEVETSAWDPDLPRDVQPGVRASAATPVDGWSVQPGLAHLKAVASEATLLFDVPQPPPSGGAWLTLRGASLPNLAQQRVLVSVNGASVGEVLFGPAQSSHPLHVPRHALLWRSPLVLVTLHMPDRRKYKWRPLVPHTHEAHSIHVYAAGLEPADR